MKSINNLKLFTFAKIFLALFVFAIAMPLHSEEMFINENGELEWGHPNKETPEDENENDNGETPATPETPTEPTTPPETPTTTPPETPTETPPETPTTTPTTPTPTNPTTPTDTTPTDPTPPPQSGDNTDTTQETSITLIIEEKLNTQASALEELLVTQTQTNTLEETADKTTQTVQTIIQTVEQTEDAITNITDTSTTIKTQNQVIIQKQSDTKNEPEDGDPVKLASGTYEQKDTDISIGNLPVINITRRYSSGNKIISSFGQGWFTNLDQRIILGTTPQDSQLIEKQQEQVATLEAAITQLQNTIITAYKTDSFENAENDLLEKKSRCQENLTETQEILNSLIELEDEAEGYTPYETIRQLRIDAETLCNKIENKISTIEQDILNLKNDLLELAGLQEKHTQAVQKQNQLAEELQLSLTRRQHNSKVMFAGMDLAYEETGLDTITVIDEEGYPHLLYETEKNSGIWKPNYISKFTECINAGNNFILYEKDGTQKYYDDNGFLVKILDRNSNYIIITRNAQGRIQSVHNSCGEKFTFEYDGSFIHFIKNTRDKNHIITYNYKGNFLSAVTDSDGDTVSLNYNSKGNLTELKKSDESSISFVYGLVDKNGNALVTSTVDEEKNPEYFDYDGDKTFYTDHDGNITVYEFDSSRHLKKVSRSDGTVIVNNYDANGNLESVNQNGLNISYGYDKQGNKTSTSYNGATEYWTYNSFCQIKTYKDRDGVNYEYIYDSKGNLTDYKIEGQTVYSQKFNSKGQLESRTDYGQQKITTTYTYDTFGNIETKTCDGIKSLYEYDLQNRVTNIFIDGKPVTEYTYKDHRIIQKDFNKLETTYITNGRKDITQIIQKDTLTGTVHKTRIEYDKRHLPIHVYTGDGKTETLIYSYLYTNEGKLREEVFHDTETWVKQYEYKNGTISLIKQFIQNAEENIFIQKLEQTILAGDERLITITNGLGHKTLFQYDCHGNLKKQTDANGTVLSKTYKPSGRLTGEQSSYGGWYEYDYTNGMITNSGERGGTAASTEYYPDGSIKNTTDLYGKVTWYNYDKKGRITSTQNKDQTVWFEYDNLNRIIKQTVSNDAELSNAIYYATFEYSDDGRTITVCEGGKYKTIYQLDAFGNRICQTDGNGNTRHFEYNSKNQLVAAYDGYENKTEYEYNALGFVNKITGPDGAVTNYNYNYQGKLEKITDACGTVYTASYDKAGRLVKERTRSGSEQTYEYDNAGRITKILCGTEVVGSYKYNEEGLNVIVTDGNGENYYYTLDLFGRLTSEKNRLGHNKDYFYDEGGKLKNNPLYSKNDFTYDALENITQAQNEYDKTEYEYDKGGRLILQKNITTGEEIRFEYDAAGNRTRLLSSNRDTRCSYGANNELKEIFDNLLKVSVQFEYNKNGQEVLRKFGNGTTEQTRYDKAGRVTLKYQKNSRGELIWGEGYVYDNNGKRSLTVTAGGLITLYEYDTQGRLSTVYYPYSKEHEDFIKNEAATNGLPSNTEAAINKYLSTSEKTATSLLLNEMQYTLANALSTMQLFIKEAYTYDKNGNRISKTTGLGTIEYKYDKENRLVSSGSRGQSFVNYSYDENGNLLSEESPLKTVRYGYNQQNRLIYCESIDKAAATFTRTKYEYDAFGRRILVQDFEEPVLRTLYDGFTFDAVKQGPVFANGTFTDSYETNSRWTITGTPTGERYRYIGDENVQDETRYFYLDENTYKAVSNRYSGERTQFSVNGSIAAQVSSGSQAEYFSTDLLGSIRTTTDIYGSATKSYSYDAFGTLVQGDLSGTTDFGYAGKQLDPTALLYNYGYRDYNPLAARFTTSDPIRDGTNWFNYCNGDPVNFVDLWGLCGVDVRATVFGSTLGELDPTRTKDAYYLIKNAVEMYDLMGKEYSTETDNVYVCTTFVAQALDISGYDSNEYLPGGQLVSASVKILGDKLITPSEGKNPSEGTYVFYHVDDDNIHGHTGIIHFDKQGNASILHNGSDGSGTKKQYVNERTRGASSGSFDTWFPEYENPVQYLMIGE